MAVGKNCCNCSAYNFLQTWFFCIAVTTKNTDPLKSVFFRSNITSSDELRRNKDKISKKTPDLVLSVL